MKLVERVVSRMLYGKPDYSISLGDRVTSLTIREPAVVVDINWALRAVAVEKKTGSVMVLPVGNVKKVSA